jgi:hypothetical protein
MPTTLAEIVGRNLRRLRGDRPQDEIARNVRDHGLRWTRGTLAGVELGRRLPSALELALVCAANGWDFRELFAGDEEEVEVVPGTVVPVGPVHVEVVPGTLVPLGLIRALTTGGGWADHQTDNAEVDLASFGDSFSIDVLSTWAAVPEPKMARYKEICPDLSPDLLAEAERASQGEAEQNAARKLELDDPLEVAVAAIALWDHSLTWERDERVAAAEVCNPGSSARTLQALRGHVTRQLLAELEPLVRKADS